MILLRYFFVTHQVYLELRLTSYIEPSVLNLYTNVLLISGKLSLHVSVDRLISF